MNLDFFLGILNSLNCGDVLNEVGLSACARYEVNPGQTDSELDEVMDYMHEVFRKPRSRIRLKTSWLGSSAGSRTRPSTWASSSIS